MTIDDPDLRIGVVGPCAAGKSTLIHHLELAGVKARHIAQEHSYVLDMWKRLTNPDILIFLDVSYPMSIRRRKLNWTVEEYLEQQRRLAHARSNANLYLMTDPLDHLEVLNTVMEFISIHSQNPENKLG